MKRKRVLVIGLGRFGSALVNELWDADVEVIAVDRQEEAVNAIKDRSAAAFVADGSDPRVLEGVGATDVDVAVVTFAEDFEACVLAVASLAQMKVRTIITRAATDRQATVLRAVGATRVVLVEHEMGRRVAPEVLSPASSDLMDYAASFRIVPWEAAGPLVGKTLADADLRRRYEISVLGYWNARTPLTARKPRPLVPGPDYRIEEGHTLLLVGLHDAVEKFLARGGQ